MRPVIRGSLELITCVVVAVACGTVDPVRETCTVTITDAPEAIVQGTTAAAHADARCSRSAVSSVRWSSDAPTVVAVDSSSGVLEALRVGSAVISASVSGVPDAVARRQVTVTSCGPDNIVSSIGIAPTLSLAAGDHVRLAVTITRRVDCRSIPGTGPVTFVSSDTSIASVAADGLLVARSAGSATVTVRPVENPSLRATTTVTVLPQPEVLVTTDSLYLAPMDTATIRVVVRRGIDARLSFVSESPCLLQVDSTGRVNALAWGATIGVQVFASVNGAPPALVRRVPVTFGPPPPVPGILFDGIFDTAAQPIGLGALRGVVVVGVRVARLAFLDAGHVEVLINDTVAGTAPLPRYTPGEWSTRVAVSANTDARDASGRPRFPNGLAKLAVRVFADGVAAIPGCTARPSGLYGELSFGGVVLTNP